MIVQTAQLNKPHFVITQVDHAQLAGRFAVAFGNHDFHLPDPQDLFLYVVKHHDEGWKPTDQLLKRDHGTDLPYNLTSTPLSDLLETGPRSVDLNERHHPFCGLLASMHICGLYNGRYGMSDKIFIDLLPEEFSTQAKQMLTQEIQRQEKLKEQLKLSLNTNEWASESRLIQHYKLLQFFDTLALYFNMTHETQRQSTVFKNIPYTENGDTDIVLSKKEPGVYEMSPFPFLKQILHVKCPGRYISPQPKHINLSSIFADSPIAQQEIILVPKK